MVCTDLRHPYQVVRAIVLCVVQGHSQHSAYITERSRGQDSCHVGCCPRSFDRHQAQGCWRQQLPSCLRVMDNCSLAFSSLFHGDVISFKSTRLYTPLFLDHPLTHSIQFDGSSHASAISSNGRISCSFQSRSSIASASSRFSFC